MLHIHTNDFHSIPLPSTNFTRDTYHDHRLIFSTLAHICFRLVPIQELILKFEQILVRVWGVEVGKGLDLRLDASMEWSVCGLQQVVCMACALNM